MALSSENRPIVSTVARPYANAAWIRLVGDLDIAAEPALTEATDRLHALTLRLIVVDLTAVTFVCSTLANFLCTLHRAHAGAKLVLHRPSPLAAVMVTVAGLDGIVVTTGVPVSRPTTATVPSTAAIPGN